MMKTANSRRVVNPRPLATGDIVFVCLPNNDLLMTLNAVMGKAQVRCDTTEEAIKKALEGGAIAILADGYPEHPTELDEALLAKASEKKIRLYVEYPATLPGFDIGQPVQDKFLRGVVVSDFFGRDLKPMRIVAINGCVHVPVNAFNAHMALARVAGVDTAVFGLDNTPITPLLFEHPVGSVLVATTRLSQFVTGRYMPIKAWQTIWQTILAWLLKPGVLAPELNWKSTVNSSFGPGELLPGDVEPKALQRAADWVIDSRALRHGDWPKEVLDRSLQFNTLLDRPGVDCACGDGSLGILEGFSSTIRGDGSQPMRYAVRSDCACEIAMLMGLDAVVNNRSRHKAIAANLLDYGLLKSDLAIGEQRANPDSPSYGLIAWELDKPDTYWADDNARAMLGALAVSGLQHETRWSDAITRCLLANLRLTGVNGHRRRCLTEKELHEKGWKFYWQEKHVENTVHMQAWLPACYLWAYTKTGFEPFLARSEAAFRTLMDAYPDKWEWVNGSGSLELARALLPFSWLLRVKDTPEHRAWLRRLATDLLALQDECGAIREVIRVGDGAYKDCIAKTNAAFGTCETSLIEKDGDPVCDSLYTCNYGLMGLHEAAAATGDPAYARAEDKLASFLCRIQTNSEKHPELSGAWYRAFNYRDWEYWASNSDSDWGPWCMETGWTQPWISGTLALRQMKTSLWDLIQHVEVGENFDRLRAHMLPDDALI